MKKAILAMIDRLSDDLALWWLVFVVVCFIIAFLSDIITIINM